MTGGERECHAAMEGFSPALTGTIQVNIFAPNVMLSASPNVQGRELSDHSQHPKLHYVHCVCCLQLCLVGLCLYVALCVSL